VFIGGSCVNTIRARLGARVEHHAQRSLIRQAVDQTVNTTVGSFFREGGDLS
jgi:hypothetical protein